MHALFLAGLILPFAITFILAAVVGAEASAFVREVQRLENITQLDRFKRLAAHSMYAALVHIVLFLVPWGFFLYGVVNEWLRQGDVWIIPVLSLVAYLFAQQYRKVEEAARSLPVDPELKAERDRVVEVWMKKVWPGW